MKSIISAALLAAAVSSKCTPVGESVPGLEVKLYPVGHGINWMSDLNFDTMTPAMTF